MHAELGYGSGSQTGALGGNDPVIVLFVRALILLAIVVLIPYLFAQQHINGERNSVVVL